MKKIWVVLLSVYVTLVTVGCVLFGVLYFDLKLGLGSNAFGRTKAECIEAIDATYKVMSFEDSFASAAAFTDADWEKKEGEEAKEKVAVFRRMIALTKGILENETYSLTNKIISFHVDDFLSSKLNLKMQFDVDGDNLYITYSMAAEGASFETTGMQYFTIDINYDYENHNVRTYQSNFYMSGSNGDDSAESCKYDATKGTFALKNSATDFASFKTQLKTEAQQFDNKTFENTDYDFSKEFKDAQKDLLGH